MRDARGGTRPARTGQPPLRTPVRGRHPRGAARGAEGPHGCRQRAAGRRRPVWARRRRQRQPRTGPLGHEPRPRRPVRCPRCVSSPARKQPLETTGPALVCPHLHAGPAAGGPAVPAAEAPLRALLLGVPLLLAQAHQASARRALGQQEGAVSFVAALATQGAPCPQRAPGHHGSHTAHVLPTATQPWPLPWRPHGASEGHTPGAKNQNPPPAPLGAGGLDPVQLAAPRPHRDPGVSLPVLTTGHRGDCPSDVQGHWPDSERGARVGTGDEGQAREGRSREAAGTRRAGAGREGGGGTRAEDAVRGAEGPGEALRPVLGTQGPSWGSSGQAAGVQRGGPSRDPGEARAVRRTGAARGPGVCRGLVQPGRRPLLHTHEPTGRPCGVPATRDGQGGR